MFSPKSHFGCLTALNASFRWSAEMMYGARMSGLRPSWPQLSSFHSSLLRRLRLRSSAERGNSQLTLIRRPVAGSTQVISSLYLSPFCRS
jgi:hypothetical protein